MLGHDHRGMKPKPGSISPQAAAQYLITAIAGERSSQSPPKRDEYRAVCFLKMRQSPTVLELMGQHCGVWRGHFVRENDGAIARFDDRRRPDQEISGVLDQRIPIEEIVALPRGQECPRHTCESVGRCRPWARFCSCTAVTCERAWGWLSSAH